METNDFKELIIKLDYALTNKTLSECLHTFNSVTHSINNFLEGDMYYLSDGGFSRLYWDIWNDGGIQVASESRQEVKEAILECTDQVHNLNTFLFEQRNKLTA